jgi:enamine deaminase RidA (YjgF/YER057c/UK114 family)
MSEIEIDIFNPAGIRAPAGTYSHVARASGARTLIAIAGQVGVSPDGVLADTLEGQCDRVFANLETALAAAGASWSNVIQTMTFLTARDQLPAYRAWREDAFARLFPDGLYPPSTLLIVSGLAAEEMLVEVQVLAAI